MPTDQEYAIGELADLAGVTPRTIRYYVSIGLLPAPEQAGPRTRYSDGQLKRLRLIRHLQRQHLPLGEIGARLGGLDDEAVEAALDADLSAVPSDSALDYINQLKGGDPAFDHRALKEIDPNQSRMLFRAIAESGPAPLAKPQLAKPPLDTRTRWERVPLSENVELHIREPLGKRKHQQIERLIRLGREMLEEGD